VIVKRVHAPKVERVGVMALEFDLLSRRIQGAAAAKHDEDRAIANRLLADQLRRTRRLSALQALLLSDYIVGKVRPTGGRTRGDDFQRVVRDMFDAFRDAHPKESEAATLRRLAKVKWAVWNTSEKDAPTLDDDDTACGIAVSRTAAPTYRLLTVPNLRRIIDAGRRVRTKADA
jgi:hypothetical protein